MISHSCLLFLPFLALAQEQAPPPEVDQALRARVEAFYQNFVEGSFSPRKAEAFVAEDTKDYFYNAGKKNYLSFRIGKITYSDNFTKAEVEVVGKGKRTVAARTVVLDEPMPTRWKIEDGKWCWTFSPYEIAATPMGGHFTRPDPNGPKSVVEMPKSLAPEDIGRTGVAEIARIAMGVDKSQVTLSADEPGSVQVTFTNGAAGPVQIGLDGPTVRGLKTTLDPTTVPGHGTAILTFKFDPADKSGPAGIYEPKGKIQFRIGVSPFNRISTVELMFTTKNTAAK